MNAEAHYTSGDMQRALESVGISEGDLIFSHSNIGFFGILENAETKSEYCEVIYRSLKNIIGDKGTLVVPTYTYSFMNNEVFDPDSAESSMGLFAEYVREHPQSSRSLDPNFSVAAIGPLAEPLIRDLPSHSFGKNSFWERFFTHGGKFCNFNFDGGSTFIHYVEKCLRVPYRWDKPFTGKIVRNGQTKKDIYYHFVRDLDNEKHHPDFASFDEFAREKGVVQRVDLGKGQIVCISASDTYKTIEEGYLEDETLLVKGETL